MWERYKMRTPEEILRDRPSISGFSDEELENTIVYITENSTDGVAMGILSCHWIARKVKHMKDMNNMKRGEL